MSTMPVRPGIDLDTLMDSAAFTPPQRQTALRRGDRLVMQSTPVVTCTWVRNAAVAGVDAAGLPRVSLVMVEPASNAQHRKATADALLRWGKPLSLVTIVLWCLAFMRWTGAARGALGLSALVCFAASVVMLVVGTAMDGHALWATWRAQRRGVAFSATPDIARLVGLGVRAEGTVVEPLVHHLLDQMLSTGALPYDTRVELVESMLATDIRGGGTRLDLMERMLTVNTWATGTRLEEEVQERLSAIASRLISDDMALSWGEAHRSLDTATALLAGLLDNPPLDADQNGQ